MLLAQPFAVITKLTWCNRAENGTGWTDDEPITEDSGTETERKHSFPPTHLLPVSVWGPMFKFCRLVCSELCLPVFPRRKIDHVTVFVAWRKAGCIHQT